MSADPAFKLAPLPTLSDTVYLETLNALTDAQDKKQMTLWGNHCADAIALLSEIGMWHEDASVTELPQLLAHAHLDAQLTKGDDE